MFCYQSSSLLCYLLHLFGNRISTFIPISCFRCIGHGGSDGLHAYVHSLDYAVMDMVCTQGSIPIMFHQKINIMTIKDHMVSYSNRNVAFILSRNPFSRKYYLTIRDFLVSALDTPRVEPLSLR